MLVSDKDLNRDGEISIYEMEQITYLDSVKYLEKSEYMTNLRSLNFNTVDLTVKEQNTLIKETTLYPPLLYFFGARPTSKNPKTPAVKKRLIQPYQKGFFVPLNRK